MEGNGVLKGVARNWDSGKMQITFEFDNDVSGSIDEIRDCMLTIVAKKSRGKRSLNANSYYWQLLTKLADKLKISNPCMHNILLRRYGQLEEIGGKLVYLILPDTDDGENRALEAETYHIKPTTEVNTGVDGMTYRTYKMLRGSSTYDTKEMSRLIEGLVADCREQGIDTLPPDEYRRMMDMYDQSWRKKHETI